MNSTILLDRKGRDCYRRGCFTEALEIYTRSIGRTPSASSLDQRAACYEKLNDLPSALKDAKQAIKLAREDPTGYLRAGKILVKMENDNVALEVYGHGLRIVKHAGKSYELLKKAHDDLLSKVSPRRSVDPFTVLPRELAIVILDYLDFRDRIAISRVSKQWDQFIRSEPRFWQQLDLSTSKKKVRNGFISKAINTARRYLTKVTLHRLYDFDKTLGALTKHCPLTSITLSDTGYHDAQLLTSLHQPDRLKELRIRKGTSVSAATAGRLFNLCSNLEILETHTGAEPRSALSLAPNLKSMTYVVNEGFKLHWTESLAGVIQNLETLNIHETHLASSSWSGEIDLSKCSRLQHLELSLQNTSWIHRAQFPLSLVILKLTNQTGEIPRNNSNGANISNISYLPHLEELSVSIPNAKLKDIAKFVTQADFEPSSDQNTASEASKPSLLRSISIKEAQCSDPDWSVFEHARLRYLETLTVTDLANFNDSHLQQLCSSLRCLQQLDVSRTSITGVGVRSVVSQGCVKRLSLNGCALGRDAVDWARTQGVKVDFKANKIVSGDGARKVNYT